MNPMKTNESVSHSRFISPGNITGVGPGEEGVGALLRVEPLHGASLDELLTELIVLLLGAREDTDILGLEELLVLLNPLDELLVGGHILDGAAISPEQQTKSTGTVGNRQVPTTQKTNGNQSCLPPILQPRRLLFLGEKERERGRELLHLKAVAIIGFLFPTLTC